MTPGARAQAAIDILDAWQAGTDGMDRVLVRWGRANRYAGSGDRAAIGDLVYDMLRRMRSAAWVAGTDLPADARTILRGKLVLDGRDPAELFTGAGYGPPALTPDEQTSRPLDDAPRSVRLDVPDWLEPRTRDLPDDALRALGARAPVDVRVNQLKTNVADAAAALLADEIETETAPLAPYALRVTRHPRRLAQSRAYREGLVEIQDAASQAVARMAAAQPGETVLDLCAGGGGKTLALAADMANKGRLVASDIDAGRLAELAPRAKRAGARIETRGSADLASLKGQCDLVLVDAPCSGLGAWRRNPDAKWRLTPDRLQSVMQTQRELIRHAAAYLAPTGRLVYATCSLLTDENDGAVDDALAALPDLVCHTRHSFSPLDGGDGFFCAILTHGNSAPLN